MSDFVRLKYAKQAFYSGGGFSGAYVPAEVKVKNIAYTKQVTLHYTIHPSGIGPWQDHVLTFKNSGGDYDVFHGSINEQAAQFVVRYDLAGATYYDNNQGQNYRFEGHLTRIGGHVALYRATSRRGVQVGGGFVFTTSWLEGEILVDNLSFAKQVGVRVSADGGASWSDTYGQYAGEQTDDGVYVGIGAERWRFKTPELNLNPAASAFLFAVFYRDLSSGITYWDNNFSQDYQLDKSEGATINCA